MASCVEVADEIYNYMQDGLPHQYSFPERANLSPFGLGLTLWVSIENAGLKSPPSLVTKEIESMRANLTRYYYESQYYLHNSKPLLTKDAYYRAYQWQWSNVVMLSEQFIGKM